MLGLKKAGLGVGVVGLGAIMGWWVQSVPAAPVDEERARLAGIRLTSPYIEARGERDGSPRVLAFRRDVEGFISDLHDRDPTLRVSLYLRELDGDAWTGVAENDPYLPASLMKVAVLFHALARLEADPTLARRSIRYPGPESMPSPDNLAGALPPIHMVAGESYTFHDLLSRMVRHSDNHAKDLVAEGVEPGAIADLMERVGVPTIVDGGVAVMTPRSYATLFRLLYRSSVFSRETSEFGLALLREATFDAGLRAGVPENVLVASKYGMHFDPRRLDAGQQLHECGIVYSPDDPYVICVMTSSLLRSAAELSEIIAEISSRAYRTLPEAAPSPELWGSWG